MSSIMWLNFCSSYWRVCFSKVLWVFCCIWSKHSNYRENGNWGQYFKCLSDFIFIGSNSDWYYSKYWHNFIFDIIVIIVVGAEKKMITHMMQMAITFLISTASISLVTNHHPGVSKIYLNNCCLHLDFQFFGCLWTRIYAENNTHTAGHQTVADAWWITVLLDFKLSVCQCLQWNISDYFSQNRSRICTDLPSVGGHDGDQVSKAGTAGGPPSSGDCMPAFDALWMDLYGRLSDLCVDQRPAVRKSAGQTLFSMIAAHGALLKKSSWQTMLWKVQQQSVVNWCQCG